jgi:type II secretory pathway pseudopilin PulG
VELLVYIAIVGIVMGAIYTTFARQQDSYIVQERLAILQQNLRGAMALLASDIQMAGYYTCYEQRAITLDWDGDAANESIRPLLLGTGNSIVLVMADDNLLRPLAAGESANAGSSTVTVTNDLGFDPVDIPYGVLVKSDLSRAEFFKVNAVGAGSPAPLTVEPAATTGQTFIESYFAAATPEQSDLIGRVDIILYTVEVDADGVSRLKRENLGDATTGKQVVAEYINALQIDYAVANDVPPATEIENWQPTTSGTKDAPPDGDGTTYDERDIRRVALTLSGTINVSPKLGNKQRCLSSTIKVRNLGMEFM